MTGNHLAQEADSCAASRGTPSSAVMPGLIAIRHPPTQTSLGNAPWPRSKPSPSEAKMRSQKGLGMGVSLPSGVFLVIAAMLLLGCEAKRPDLNTAPQDGADVEASKDIMPSDVVLSEDPLSVEISASSTLGDPLAGLTA